MKYALTLILALFIVRPGTWAQISVPVRFLDGAVEVPFAEANENPRGLVRAARIRAIFVQDATDTPAHLHRSQFARYTEQGDNIHHNRSLGDYAERDRYDYNRDGTPALRQWTEDYMVGCGTGGYTRRVIDNHTKYVYEKGRLIRTETFAHAVGDSTPDSMRPSVVIQEHHYDRRGRKTTALRYGVSFRPKPDTTMYDEPVLYCYDDAGRLTQVFLADQYAPNYGAAAQARLAAVVEASPDTLGEMLLRLCFQAKDSALGLLPPARHGLSDEERWAEEEAFEKREESDDSLTNFYTGQESGFSGVLTRSYDARGRLTHRLVFVRDDLTRRDTFSYDALGRLVRWEVWHLDIDDDFQSWEPRWAGTSMRPTHHVWTFFYNTDGRVQQCALRTEESASAASASKSYAFRPTNNGTYTFLYDAQGRVARVREDAEEFREGAASMVRTYSREFAVTFETY